jgi:hypothetical protein
MRYLAVAFTLLFSVVPVLSGQSGRSTENLPGDLSLNIRSISFIKNNEYFNPIGVYPFVLAGNLPVKADKSLWIEGYTLTGFWINPELVYNASDKITLKGGVHLLKYSGLDRFTKVRPLFSASLALSEKTVLTLGSLSGSEKHQMFDPHFNSERIYWANYEEGLQIKTKSDHIFNDTWINWENYIFYGDTTREVFTFGESFRYSSSLIADYLTVEIPVQVQFKHFGGQISDYPEHVTTFFNLAAGIRFNIEPQGKRLGKAGFEYLHFFNNVIPSREGDLISHGDAYWLRFHYNYKGLYAGIYYWNARNFYAPNGNGIYASVFKFNSDYKVPAREILTTSAYLNILPESFLELFFGFDTYYDLCARHLDHALTLHLNFEKMFRITNLK